jgi:hypothetical protein
MKDSNKRARGDEVESIRECKHIQGENKKVVSQKVEEERV